MCCQFSLVVHDKLSVARGCSGEYSTCSSVSTANFLLFLVCGRAAFSSDLLFWQAKRVVKDDHSAGTSIDSEPSFRFDPDVTVHFVGQL